ncbi:uncharacterized protein LOC125369197 [Ricinus communis]|uniref:uncharacterized protein LOC125369197 n=1 Tax=Ricinus communis TaxID=3988 RepID=UPI00201A40FF|nr:uncharacterized protein LOC125369197 [Ricinus communis]
MRMLHVIIKPLFLLLIHSRSHRSAFYWVITSRSVANSLCHNAIEPSPDSLRVSQVQDALSYIQTMVPFSSFWVLGTKGTLGFSSRTSSNHDLVLCSINAHILNPQCKLLHQVENQFRPLYNDAIRSGMTAI